MGLSFLNENRKQSINVTNVMFWLFSSDCLIVGNILGDPGADILDVEKVETGAKNSTK